MLNSKLDKVIALLEAKEAKTRKVGEFKSKKVEGLAGMVAAFKTNDGPVVSEKKKKTVKSGSKTKKDSKKKRE